jgi:hypothetical protein
MGTRDGKLFEVQFKIGKRTMTVVTERRFIKEHKEKIEVFIPDKGNLKGKLYTIAPTDVMYIQVYRGQSRKIKKY